jgi:hypothetical protein
VAGAKHAEVLGERRDDMLGDLVRAGRAGFLVGDVQVIAAPISRTRSTIPAMAMNPNSELANDEFCGPPGARRDALRAPSLQARTGQSRRLATSPPGGPRTRNGRRVRQASLGTGLVNARPQVRSPPAR